MCFDGIIHTTNHMPRSGYFSKMSLNGCFSCLQFQSDEVITKLDLSNNVLTDSFPDVWQYERTLEELKLASTRINTLPPQLFYCQGLRILVVNSNSLESIPSAIGSLRHLQTLNLSRNLISNIPEGIKTCKHLTHLDLSYNNLQRFPDALTRLISLQELFLNETYLEFLPANFGRLVNLRILELRLNNLTTLPKSMVRLCSLNRLDIGGNEFNELPEVIGELRQLRELWVDFNQIHYITANIGNLRELLHFESNGNLISLLPNELCDWHNIEVLSVCTNNLETFPFSMGMLRSLVTLKCEMNELCELPDSISNLENLEELVLSHNKLLRLPTTIGMLRKLAYLFVDDNELHNLPDEICSCSSLCVLSVNRNKIIELPQNIGRLNKLKVLNLVKNYICTLPVSILSLVNLTSLWISDNQSQPLVPLQYVDIATKTQLTCFMLPQSSVRIEHQEKQNDMRTEDYAKEQLICNTKQQLQEQPLGCSGNDMNSYTSPTRRTICFAEKATIMSDTPETSHVVNIEPTETNERERRKNSHPIRIDSNIDNSRPALNCTFNNTNSCDTAESEGETTAIGVRLLRSPTPYPKELRLMAKYVRNAQKSACTTSNNRKLNNISKNNNRCNNIVCHTKNVNGNNLIMQKQLEKNVDEIKGAVCNEADMYNNTKICQQTRNIKGLTNILHGVAQNYQHLQQHQPNQRQNHKRELPENQKQLLGLQKEQHILDNNVHIRENFYTAYYVTPHHMNSLYAKNITPAYHYSLNQYQQQNDITKEQQIDLLPNNYYIGGRDDGLATLPYKLEPPAYYIARVFTRKTPEDLTNYETMRHQFEQGQVLKIHTPITSTVSISNQVVEFHRNTFDLQNYVEYNHRNANFCPKQFEVIKSEQKEASVNNQVQVSAANNINYTNSLASQQQHNLKHFSDSLSQLSNSSGNSINTNIIIDNSAVSQDNYGNLNSGDILKRKTTKKTPWLFGTHKNPTVIQVTLKVEHQIGFEISELPNKEGIFVSFIVPNTAAARMLCARDKLLEIDGHDFTNINLSDAKNVILNAGSIMNIMLSRK